MSARRILEGARQLRHRPGACVGVFALVALLAIASCWGVIQ